MYDIEIEKEKRKLEHIRDRYFRPVIAYPAGHLCHHGDCSVHRSIDVYGTAACTCGFLHDLTIVTESLKSKLHPAFYEELCLEDGPPRTPTPEDKEEMEKLLDKLGFKPAVGPSPQEWEATCIQDWALVEDVFGEGFRKRKEIEWLALDDEEC